MDSIGVAEDLRLTALRGRIRSLIGAIEKINAADGLGAIADAIVLHSAALLGSDASCLLLKVEDSLWVQSSFGCGEGHLAALAHESAQWQIQKLAGVGDPAIYSLLAGGDGG